MNRWEFDASEELDGGRVPGTTLPPTRGSAAFRWCLGGICVKMHLDIAAVNLNRQSALSPKRRYNPTALPRHKDELERGTRIAS